MSAGWGTELRSSALAVAATAGDSAGSAWASVLGTIRTGRVAMCSSRLATLPSRRRGRSVRLLEPSTTRRASWS